MAVLIDFDARLSNVGHKCATLVYDSRHCNKRPAFSFNIGCRGSNLLLVILHCAGVFARHASITRATDGKKIEHITLYMYMS